jgi:hypothetical protein
MHRTADRHRRGFGLLTMATIDPRSKSQKPPREQLVEHLVGCMKRAGVTVEAADASGYKRPRHVKRLGLRQGRFRPDVVARDGRRSVLGVAKSGSELSEAHLPDQLEAFAQKCRLLVVCVTEADAEQALEALFPDTDTPHRLKLRLLRYPRPQWEDVPKAAGRKRLQVVRGYDVPVIVHR